MTHRLEQIGSVMQRAISEVLQRDLSDPRIEGLISITRVKVSPDMKQAVVYVTVMPEQNQSKVLHGLRHAAGHIHKLAKKRVSLRTVPHLIFRLDESLKKEAEVYRAIHDGIDRTGRSDLSDEADAESPDGQS